MTGVIVAIVVGFIIAMIEKSMSKGAGEQAKSQRPRSVSVRPQGSRPTRVIPRTPLPTPVKEADSTPFLQGEESTIRVTDKPTETRLSTPRPTFTPKQQELRRTIIMGEILRRKF